MYECEIKAFIDSRDVVNDLRVVTPVYIVKSCGVPFVFRNEKFPCDFFM